MMTKLLYKIELILLKSLPLGIALCYLLNSILSYFNINAEIYSYLGGMSLLPLIFVLVSSFVFKFCVYHRLPIYYIIVSDIINYYDLYIGIPLENRELFIMNMTIAGIFIVLIVFTKAKICKNH